MISGCSTQFRDKAELLSNFPINWPAIMIRPYQSGLLGHDLIPEDIFRIFSCLISEIIILCVDIFCFHLHIASPGTRHWPCWHHVRTLDCNWPLSHIGERERERVDRWCRANALTCCEVGSRNFHIYNTWHNYKNYHPDHGHWDSAGWCKVSHWQKLTLFYF